MVGAGYWWILRGLTVDDMRASLLWEVWGARFIQISKIGILLMIEILPWSSIYYTTTVPRVLVYEVM